MLRLFSSSRWCFNVGKKGALWIDIPKMNIGASWMTKPDSSTRGDTHCFRLIVMFRSYTLLGNRGFEAEVVLSLPWKTEVGFFITKSFCEYVTCTIITFDYKIKTLLKWFSYLDYEIYPKPNFLRIFPESCWTRSAST